MPRCLIGLGANLGDPAATLDAALAMLGDRAGVRLLAASSYLETAPIGGPEGQGKFLNACAVIETELPAREVVRTLLDVEASLGRTRRTRWEARLLDLDLLLYGEDSYREEGVQVPHPRMASRRFVLDPASEIAADMVHPTTGWTIGTMARHLQEAPNVAFVTGLPGVGKSTLVRRLSQLERATNDRFDVVFDPLGSKARPPLTSQDPVDEMGVAEARVEVLKPRVRASGPTDVRSTVVDFWPGQSLLWMKSRPRLTSIAEEYVVGVSKALPAPKLLIDLYLPTTTLTERWIERGWATTAEGDRIADWMERWQAILRAHAPAPWIRIDASNSERALAESLAALEAMRG